VRVKHGSCVIRPPSVSKLRAWGGLANQVGLREEFAAALREIDEQLTHQPEGWGDPVKDYRGLHLTLYQHYGPILIVKYAVHIDGTPVFVLDVQLTPDTPLYYDAR
jgi:hypothetical protein